MKSAIVLGGGVAGVAAAHALINAGWQVRLSERAARSDQVGAALSMWPNAMAALDRLGLADAVRAGGLRFTTMLVADREERPIIPAQPIDGEALLVTRADLQSALVDHLPPGVVSLGCAVSGIHTDEENVGVGFADGRIERADIHGSAVAAQPISGDALRRAVTLQRLLHECERGALVPRARDVALEDLTLMIDRSPEVDHLAAQLHGHFVEVPPPVAESPHAADPSAHDLAGEHGTEPVTPEPHRLVAEVNPAFEQQVFDVPKAERKPYVHQDHQPDNLRRGVEVAERTGGLARAGHDAGLARPAHRPVHLA